jgi:hypothetical protein
MTMLQKIQVVPAAKTYRPREVGCSVWGHTFVLLLGARKERRCDPTKSLGERAAAKRLIGSVRFGTDCLADGRS